MVCTSIGLAHKGVPVVGVIYNPFMDQLVSSIAPLSATISGREAHHRSTLLRKGAERT